MPLNNSKLTKSIIEDLKGIPYDTKYDNLPYPTKVDIYDSKCSGCGFARIEVVTIPLEKIYVFNNIENALLSAQGKSVMIHRLCSYPSDVDKVFDEERYVTLNEIICNSCEFWDMDKLRIPSDSETEFIEIDTAEKVNEPRPQTVSQQ